MPVTDLRVLEVDAGPLSPRELVGWRLGHAHMAGFVTRLAIGDRRRLVSQAERAVGPVPQTVRRRLLILSSQVPA